MQDKSTSYYGKYFKHLIYPCDKYYLKDENSIIESVESLEA